MVLRSQVLLVRRSRRLIALVKNNISTLNMRHLSHLSPQLLSWGCLITVLGVPPAPRCTTAVASPRRAPVASLPFSDLKNPFSFQPPPAAPITTSSLGSPPLMAEIHLSLSHHRHLSFRLCLCFVLPVCFNWVKYRLFLWAACCRCFIWDVRLFERG